jgi:hypothetical protein
MPDYLIWYRKAWGTVMGAVAGFILAFAITLLGFWPSFFSNPASNDLGHMLHGLLATGWMIILITQASLMAAGKVRLHHLIGRASMVWVAALLFTAVGMVRVMLSARGGFLSPEMRLMLGFIDVNSLVLFAGFYISAIVCAFQRRIDHHLRLMACTVLIAIIPALGRVFAFFVPGVHGFNEALPLTFLTLEAVSLGLLAYDFFRLKRVYPAYLVVLGGLVYIHLTMTGAPRFGPYLMLARALGYPA